MATGYGANMSLPKWAWTCMCPPCPRPYGPAVHKTQGAAWKALNKHAKRHHAGDYGVQPGYPEGGHKGTVQLVTIHHKKAERGSVNG